MSTPGLVESLFDRARGQTVAALAAVPNALHDVLRVPVPAGVLAVRAWASTVLVMS